LTLTHPALAGHHSYMHLNLKARLHTIFDEMVGCQPVLDYWFRPLDSLWCYETNSVWVSTNK